MTPDHKWLYWLLLSVVFMSTIVTAVNCNSLNCDPNASCINGGNSDICKCNSPEYIGNGTYCNLIDPNATFSDNYIYNQYSMTFDQAEAFCNSRYGTHLASILNANEQIETSNLCNGQCWIGLSDTDQEGTFKWIDGSPFSYSDWDPNEPNNHGGNEDCTDINLSHHWNDVKCTLSLNFFLCNIQNAPTNNPTVPSSSPSNYPTTPSVPPTTANPTSPSIPPTTAYPTVPSVPPTPAPTFDPLWIICTDQSPCDGTINCVADQQCTIQCIGDYACDYSLNIDGRSATHLEVVVNGEYAFDSGTKIYCPDNGPYSINTQASCVLRLLNSHTDIFELEIFAVEGFNDVFIDTTSQSSLDATLHCKPDYSASCMISDPHYNICSPASICDDYKLTVSPTLKPTNDPTNNPSNLPSKYPTKSPSKYPTSKSPTKYPTISPTNFPTKSPTYNPSITPTKYPTKIPTKSPTYNPSIPPTKYPTKTPSISPTKYPTKSPTTPSPTLIINYNPTSSPTTLIFTTTNNLTTEIPLTTLLSHDQSSSALSMLVIMTVVVLVVVFLFICGFCMWRKRLSNQFKYTKNFTQPLLVEITGNILHNEHSIEQNYTHSNTHNPRKQNIKSNDHDIVESINKLDETSTGVFTSTSRDDNITNGGDSELLDYVNKTENLEPIQNELNSDTMDKYVGDNYEQNEIGNAVVSTIGARADEKKDDENNNADEIYEGKDVAEGVVKNERESSKCVICMDKATQYACIPCGHHCLCETCKDIIDNKCPVCMTTCTVLKIVIRLRSD